MDGEGGRRGAPGITLVGTLIFNDTLTLDSVLVSIKGQTSDSRNNTEKKSFKIEIDEILDQDLLGYDNLNLNCAFDDHSGMREALFLDLTRTFTPALKGAFVDLYINGQSWGPYNNIQQIEGTYIKEWFGDNDGTRWRAVAPDGITNPGGPFGTGLSSLNYNGPDSSDYNRYYTLKRTEKDDPWQDLIDVCQVLDEAPIDDLYTGLNDIFDMDRALWFLAQEMVFSDDDSYINKGGMDYYVYWDNATGRLMPLEVDANSVMNMRYVTWSPFYREDDPRFPLIYRVMQNTELRQRYLAHLRTVLEDYFIEGDAIARIDEFADILDQRVQDDPKKIYSYDQFVDGVEELKQYVRQRIAFLMDHNEIDRTGLEVSELTMTSDAGLGQPPVAYEDAMIEATVEGDVAKVVLYYGTSWDGAYSRVDMTSNGNGVFTASIPGFAQSTLVRYYIEAIQDDAFSTATYYPPGAEHDVFIYQVSPVVVTTEDVVINEFMASNDETVADNAGEYDDWIELYNKGNTTVDLSNFFLSDKEDNITKWDFPDNTFLEPNDYLIIWADEDGDQETPDDLHCNFKLSAGGEAVVLVNGNEEIIDKVVFQDQETDLSMARRPNGVGDFVIGAATFNANNDGLTNTDEDFAIEVKVYPNPTVDRVFIDYSQAEEVDVRLFNNLGQEMPITVKSATSNRLEVDLALVPNGTYQLAIRTAKHNQLTSVVLNVIR